MGALRGNDIQQMFTAACLVKRLKELEAHGKLMSDAGILVIPCAAQFSMNVGHRFWPLDNTDINRMFPGYDGGETTQRLADRIFSALRDYEWGIHLASFYLPGDFLPHVRFMDTGYQQGDLGLDFGLPYLVVRQPHPYDTTTLNYNWQIFETKTFSLYTKETGTIDEESAQIGVDAILRFLVARGILTSDVELPPPAQCKQIYANEFLSVRTSTGGLLLHKLPAGSEVAKGDVLGEVVDPYTTDVKEKLLAPADGQIFFTTNAQLVTSENISFRIIPTA